MNTHCRRILIALALVLAGAGALIFCIFYQEAKTTAIKELNEEQIIHAKQAARTIEDFFAMGTRNLSALAETDKIVDNEGMSTYTFART